MSFPKTTGKSRRAEAAKRISYRPPVRTQSMSRNRARFYDHLRREVGGSRNQIIQMTGQTPFSLFLTAMLGKD